MQVREDHDANATWQGSTEAADRPGLAFERDGRRDRRRAVVSVWGRNWAKSVPDDFVGRIVQWAELDKPTREDLEHAAAISRKEFKVGVNRDMSDSELHTAALLARFDQLPTEDREHIRQILLRRFG